MAALLLNIKKGATMKDYQELAYVMIRVCEIAGVPFTNDIGVFLDSLCDVGFMSKAERKYIDRELNRRSGK